MKELVYELVMIENEKRIESIDRRDLIDGYAIPMINFIEGGNEKLLINMITEFNDCLFFDLKRYNNEILSTEKRKKIIEIETYLVKITIENHLKQLNRLFK